STLFTVLQGGNVGIGTTAPSQKLDVYKTAVSGLQVASDNGGDAILDLMELNTGASFGAVGTGGFRWIMDGGDNKLYLQSGNEATVNTRLTIERDTGNVGIGTTNPGEKLQVAGIGKFGVESTTQGEIHIANSSGTALFKIKNLFGSPELSVNSISDRYLNIINEDVSKTLGLTIEGNVGIGTTNPTTKLYVSGGTGDVVNVGGGRIRGLNTTPVNADEAVPLTYLQSNYAPLGSGAGGIGIGTSGQTLRHNGTSWVANSVLFNNGTNVGIGTTNPGNQNAMLEVAGRIGSFVNTDWNGIYVGESATKYTAYNWRNNLERAELYTAGYDYPILIQNSLFVDTDTNNGNVGIGTTNPTQKLLVNDGNIHINTPNNSSAGNGIRLNRPGATYAGFEIATNNTVDWSIGANSAGFGIYEDGQAATTRFIIKDGGTVGIGTTSIYPNVVSLQVNGAKNTLNKGIIGVMDNTSSAAGVGGRIIFGGKYNSAGAEIMFSAIEGIKENSTDNNYAGALVLGTLPNNGNLTERMRITSSGNVGIGTTNPTTKLYVNGGTGDVVNVGGGRIRGLNTTPVNNDEAVPLLYLENNYAPLIKKHTSVADVNYTVLADDYVVAYTSLTANRTVTLPDALCTPGRFYVIVDESGQAGLSKAIVIDPEGATPIVGGSTYNLMGPYNSVYVFCGNNAWFIL
ncbi:hypothetical protein GW765_04810, partial [Candidatus Parcubacteria bacterium]|nr:hypothetical protein [Candidatus Parcubacteria bacterium]